MLCEQFQINKRVTCEAAECDTRFCAKTVQISPLPPVAAGRSQGRNVAMRMFASGVTSPAIVPLTPSIVATISTYTVASLYKYCKYFANYILQIL